MRALCVPVPVGSVWQPVCEQVRRVRADGGAVALAVARVGRVAGAALALEVVGADDDASAGGVLLERLGDRRPVARCAVAAVDEGDRVQRGRRADRRDAGRLVEQADLDRVVAERVHLARAGIGIDEGVRARSGRLVQPVDEELDRAVGAVAVVLDLADPDHVAAGTDDRGDGLRPLAVELARVVGAAAVRCPAADAPGARVHAEGVEEVEQVHPDDRQRAPDGGRHRRPRVDRREARDAAAERTDRPQAIGVPARGVAGPGVGHDADHRSRRVASAQRVRRAERVAAAAEQDRVGILTLAGVVDDQPVQVVRRLHRERCRAG